MTAPHPNTQLPSSLKAVSSTHKQRRGGMTKARLNGVGLSGTPQSTSLTVSNTRGAAQERQGQLRPPEAPTPRDPPMCTLSDTTASLPAGDTQQVLLRRLRGGEAPRSGSSTVPRRCLPSPPLPSPRRSLSPPPPGLEPASPGGSHPLRAALPAPPHPDPVPGAPGSGSAPPPAPAARPPAAPPATRPRAPRPWEGRGGEGRERRGGGVRAGASNFAPLQPLPPAPRSPPLLPARRQRREAARRRTRRDDVRAAATPRQGAGAPGRV